MPRRRRQQTQARGVGKRLERACEHIGVLRTHRFASRDRAAVVELNEREQFASGHEPSVSQTLTDVDITRQTASIDIDQWKEDGHV
jgi:hypothetical protein